MISRDGEFLAQEKGYSSARERLATLKGEGAVKTSLPGNLKSENSPTEFAESTLYAPPSYLGSRNNVKFPKKKSHPKSNKSENYDFREAWAAAGLSSR